MKTRSFPERELHEAVAFALLPGVGCLAYKEGIERHGSASAAFREYRHEHEKAGALDSARQMVDTAAERSIALVIQGESSYPQCLLELHDPPCFVAALGDTTLMSRRRVGIVGTRHASASGERIAQALAECIVRAGAVVVSGMAFGIDAAAHRGALEAGGGTIAVLGSGVDVPYPPRHRALHERIARHGLVVSEAPIGAHPTPGAFPRRNRIIAALSETLVVIEAGERSGALITSRHALELGRTVAAVPGPIDSPRHAGSNRLLADGAAFIAQLEDIVHLAELEHQEKRREPHAEVADDTHRQVLAALATGVSDIDGLARNTRLGVRDVVAALTSLEMAGRLQVNASGVVDLSSR